MLLINRKAALEGGSSDKKEPKNSWDEGVNNEIPQPEEEPTEHKEKPPAPPPPAPTIAKKMVFAKPEEPPKEEEVTPTAWLNEVFTEAVRLQASDIHITPEKEYISVRFRLNGMIHEVARWDIDYHEMVISRIKVIAGLQVVEKNIPQDGRLELIFETKTDPKGPPQPQSINFRISTMPTINGEAVVLRALNREGKILNMNEVGLSETAYPTVSKMMQRGHGVVLMTGHSGSGKTTTLYAALNLINSIDKAIITIEDPVEYRLDGIRQSQVSFATGYDFQNGLRAILRQDPDVIMIGEIRDNETASTALRLALVGRLVLTTLHTNNIIGAITRLLEMKIERSVIASALTGIITERLVRKICPNCKAEALPPYDLMKTFGVEWPEGVKVYEGKGCDQCLHTGFIDRVGIFEVLELDEPLMGLIISGANITELEAYVESHVVETLREDGFAKVRNGITTLEEVIRVTI